MSTENSRERWQLVADAPAIYERHLVPALFGAWAPVLIEEAGSLAGKRVLDVACGTGVVARLAAERAGPSRRVVGLDTNPGMLAVARTHPTAVRCGIEWQEADAEQIPFPDATFDVVFCQLGLQYFVDRSAALSEMHRVLVPAGTLVVMVWRSIEHSPGFDALARALERHVSSQAAATARAPFVFGDDAGPIRRLLVAAGFHDVAIRSVTGTVRFRSARDLVRHTVAASPLAGPVGAVSDEARHALVDEVRTALTPYQSREAVVFPVQAHVAKAARILDHGLHAVSEQAFSAFGSLP